MDPTKRMSLYFIFSVSGYKLIGVISINLQPETLFSPFVSFSYKFLLRVTTLDKSKYQILSRYLHVRPIVKLLFPTCEFVPCIKVFRSKFQYESRKS